MFWTPINALKGLRFYLQCKGEIADIVWMTTLLGMLLVGSLEMTSSGPDPEDDGAEPGEPKTADLPGQDQFQPARVNPLTVKPAEFDP